MYNIFYIYTYKYKTSNTLTLSRTQRHTSQHRINSLISNTNNRKPQAVYIWAKMHKPHNAPSHIAERSEHMRRF